MKNYDLTMKDITKTNGYGMQQIVTFKKWLSDNGYKATNGTLSFPESGLTDYHTKEGVYYSTIKLCIEYNDR